VSYAAVRSIKATPVFNLLSYPSSIYWVRFKICPQHDLPGRKPACSLINFLSSFSATRFKIIRSRILYRWHSRAIGRKLLASFGSFPGFNTATTLACLHSLGIFNSFRQAFINCTTHFRVAGPNCFICSILMSSVPAALITFMPLIAKLSSSTEKGR
jgi:hypothetical protein